MPENTPPHPRATTVDDRFFPGLGAWRRESEASAHDPDAYKTLVASLYSSPASLIPGAFACLLTPILCWSATKDDVFLGLTAMIVIAIVLRIATVTHFCIANHENDTRAETRRWARRFILGATSVSTILGANCYYALTHSTCVSAHITAISVNIAFASGFVARNAALPKFVVLQLLVFCLPLATGLISSNDPYYRAIGFFSLFYVVNNIAIVASVHRNLLDMVMAMKKSRVYAVELASRNTVLDAALNHMSHGLAMFDNNLNLAVANKRHEKLFCTLSGQGPATLETTARHVVDCEILTPANALELTRTGQEVAMTGLSQTRQFKTLLGDDYVVTFSPAAENSIVMLTEDATLRISSQAKIERLARFDTLTGLANRYEITKRIDKECKKTTAQAGRFAVLFLDLDGFKAVNDTLGHEVGDALLAQVAQRLSIMVADKGVTGRLGGDEFVILLHDASLEEARAMASALLGALVQPFAIAACVVRTSASIGIALAPNDAEFADHLLRCADMALYSAKAGGRGVIVAYNNDIAALITERQTLETDLRAAIDSDELTMAYQPIASLKTGEICGYEALMRWTHPTRGSIGPDIFIPIAEKSGLIEALGLFAIKKSCADAAVWPDNVTVSINVSPIQFHNPDILLSHINAALAESGLPPHRMILEITESALIDDAKTTLETMRIIAALGVRFALDDFGTGYSSLSTLSEFPFSVIKIDKSLSERLGLDQTRFTIVETICQLSLKLNLDVVVEGVETAEQRAIIHMMGATRGQGWLFGRPMPASAIIGDEQSKRQA